MSTFSSNIHRVYQAIEWGLKYNRKVCVIGRSMERNLYTAMELGYIKLDKKIFIDANEVDKFKDDEVLVNSRQISFLEKLNLRFAKTLANFKNADSFILHKRNGKNFRFCDLFYLFFCHSKFFCTLYF